MTITEILTKHNLTVDLVYDKVRTDRIYKAIKEWGRQEYIKGFEDGKKEPIKKDSIFYTCDCGCFIFTNGYCQKCGKAWDIKG